jgi:hypothetical protein
MSEPARRRNLLAGLDKVQAPAPGADDALIAAVAERHGFAPAPETESASPSVTSPTAPTQDEHHEPDDDELYGSQITVRRRRKPKGRTEQLNVRLRPDTIASIYEEANRRDVPIAQVIEEMVEAFQVQRSRASN